MSDLERRLSELYATDSRSRRIANVRIGRPSAAGSFLASAAAIAVLALAVGLAAYLVRDRGDTPPVAASPSPTAATASASPPSACADRRSPGEQWLGLSVELPHVTVTLDRVSVDGAGRAAWTFRYFVHGTAPRPAVLAPKLEFTGATVVVAQGDSIVGPPNAGGVPFRSPVEVAPCSAVIEIVPTNTVASGMYTVTLAGLTTPDGAAQRFTLQADLDCPARGACTRAGQARPSPTASPDRAVLRDNWLVVFDGAATGWDKGNAPLVKRETEALAVGELAPSFFNQFHGAVSPDGRRAVYSAWAQTGPRELYLVEGARPNVRTKLLSLPNEIGGANVWSTDGEGILFSVTDAGADQGVRPTYSALRTLVIATGAVREVARVEGGAYLHGMAWDRATDRIVYTETPYATDAARYHVIEGGRSRPGPEQLLGFAWSHSDGRTIVVLRSGTLSVTTLDDPTRMRQLVQLPANGGIVGWRPSTREFVLYRGATPTRAMFFAVDVDTGATRDIGEADTQGVSGRAFRADGSALLIDLGRGRGLVLDLTSGRTAELPRDPQERRLSGSLRAD